MQAEQHPYDRAISVRVPAAVERAELEDAQHEEGRGHRDRDHHCDAHGGEVVPQRRVLRPMVGEYAREHHARVDRAPQESRRRHAQRPRVGEGAQVEIRADRQGEHRALDGDHAHRGPPHDAARAEGIARKLCQRREPFIELASLFSILSSFESLQQLANVVVIIFLAVQKMRLRSRPELPSILLDVWLVNMSSAVTFGADTEQLMEATCV